MNEEIEIKLNFKEKIIYFFGFIVGSIFLLKRTIEIKLLDRKIKKDIMK